MTICSVEGWKRRFDKKIHIRDYHVYQWWNLRSRYLCIQMSDVKPWTSSYRSHNLSVFQNLETLIQLINSNTKLNIRVNETCGANCFGETFCEISEHRRIEESCNLEI